MFWVSLAERREEAERLMEQKEKWFTLWMNPKSGLSEYIGYDCKAYNVVVVGRSGNGK